MSGNVNVSGLGKLNIQVKEVQGFFVFEDRNVWIENLYLNFCFTNKSCVFNKLVQPAVMCVLRKYAQKKLPVDISEFARYLRLEKPLCRVGGPVWLQ